MSIPRPRLCLNPVPVAVIPYVDTVQIWLEKETSKADLKLLQRQCGYFHSESKQPWWNPRLRFRLQLHQPSEPALRLLDRFVVNSESTFIINQVELALDLITADFDELRELRDFIALHIVKRWHGKQRNVYCEETYYSRKNRWGSHQLVQYSTRPSKVTGQPCVHLEWRAGGKVQVEAIGIYNLIQLATFNHREFWAKRLCLEEVDYTMLGKQILKRGRAKKPLQHGPYGDWDVRVGRLIGTAAAARERGPISQDIRDWCSGQEWFRPETAMRRIDVEPYLPPKDSSPLYNNL